MKETVRGSLHDIREICVNSAFTTTRSVLNSLITQNYKRIARKVKRFAGKLSEITQLLVTPLR